jgi:hypothetical protein
MLRRLTKRVLVVQVCGRHFKTSHNVGLIVAEAPDYSVFIPSTILLSTQTRRTLDWGPETRIHSLKG